MLIVLDSTVLIDYLRGRPVVSRVEGLAAAGHRPVTTAVNVEETVRGLRTQELMGARRLFRGLDVLPITRHVAWQAGSWRREYAQRGITLSQADCLVAAAAARKGARVATGNPRHFPMTDVAVEHWPVGE